MEHVPSMQDKSKAATLRSVGSVSDSPSSTRRGSQVRDVAKPESRNLLASGFVTGACWARVKASKCEKLKKEAPASAVGLAQCYLRFKFRTVCQLPASIKLTVKLKVRTLAPLDPLSQGNTNTSQYSISSANTNTGGSVASMDSTGEGAPAARSLAHGTTTACASRNVIATLAIGSRCSELGGARLSKAPT